MGRLMSLIWALSHFLFWTLCIYASASPFALAASPTPKLEKVTSAYTTIGGIITPIWIPLEKGIFQKYGLDVTMRFLSTGPVVLSALIAGETDITTVGAEPIAGAILGGADVSVIAFVTTTTPLSLHVVPTITQVEQLRGASVAVSRLASSSAYMLKVALKKAGLEPIRDVTVIQAGGIPESLAALHGGKVQGAMLSPPISYKAEELGFKRIWSGLGVEYPSLTLAARKAYLRNSEEVTLRFLRAIAEGVHIFKTDKEEAIKVMSKYTKVTDRTVLEKTYEDNREVHSQTLEPTSSGIKNILETLGPTNPKAATARPEDFIDPRFVKKLEESGYFRALTGR